MERGLIVHLKFFFFELVSYGGPDDESNTHPLKIVFSEKRIAINTIYSYTCSRVVAVTSSCNTEVSNNVTYFVNPNFPGLLNDVGECSLRVKKVSKDISQIRLDFVNFNLVSVAASPVQNDRKITTLHIFIRTIVLSHKWKIGFSSAI